MTVPTAMMAAVSREEPAQTTAGGCIWVCAGHRTRRLRRHGVWSMAGWCGAAGCAFGSCELPRVIAPWMPARRSRGHHGRIERLSLGSDESANRTGLLLATSGETWSRHRRHNGVPSAGSVGSHPTVRFRACTEAPLTKGAPDLPTLAGVRRRPDPADRATVASHVVAVG